MPQENGYNFLKNGPFLPRFRPVVAKNGGKRGSTQKSEKLNSDRKIGILAENGQK